MQQSIDEKDTNQMELSLQGVNRITISCHTTNVYLFQSAGGNATIRWTEGDHWQMRIDQQDGALMIAEEETRTIWDIFSRYSEANLYVGIPTDYPGVLLVETTTGHISVDGINSISRVDLRTSRGYMSVNKLYTHDGFCAECNEGNLAIHNMATKGPIWISSSAGSISAKNVATDAGCTVICLSGGCRLSTMHVAKQLVVESNSGTWELDNVQADTMKANIASSGSMAIAGLYVERSAKMHANTGSICCNIDDAMNQYTVYCHSNHCANDLEDMSGSGPKRLHIVTNTGLVQVGFSGSQQAMAQ